MSRTRPAASLLLALAASLLGACAPVSRVILLPEASGKSSAVEVRTRAGSTPMSRPYQRATVDAQGTVTLSDTSADAVREQYPQLLALRPAPPLRFVLYFVEGSTRLTPESQARLGDVLARAGERPGGEIIVTGHTDRLGTVDANDALGRQRAQTLRALLIGQGFAPERIETVSRGEHDPAVPTADEVGEPQNRHAEIVVR
jgi:outer membrane protein OmpA-like peptidoglycan-associated protein